MRIIEIGKLLTRNWSSKPEVEDLSVMFEDSEEQGNIESALQSCRIVLCGSSCIAIAPRSAMEDDVLVVIEGAPSPCLIRPSFNGTWSLISGDCHALSLDPSTPLGHKDQEDHGFGKKTWEFLRDMLGEPEVFHLS